VGTSRGEITPWEAEKSLLQKKLSFRLEHGVLRGKWRNPFSKQERNNETINFNKLIYKQWKM